MEKRGQITIFIIIAVVVIAGVISFLAFKNSGGQNGGNSNISPDILGAKKIVEECVKKNAEFTIPYLSLFGGYYNSPENMNADDIPYYSIGYRSYVPEKATIEGEISELTAKLASMCLNNSNEFREINSRGEELKIKTNIQDSFAEIETIYPLIIFQAGNSLTLDKYEKMKIPIRLGRVLNVSKEIIKENIEVNPKQVCLSCSTKLALENDLFIQILYNSNGEAIYLIIDKNSEVLDKLSDGGQDFQFRFAVK